MSEAYVIYRYDKTASPSLNFYAHDRIKIRGGGEITLDKKLAKKKFLFSVVTGGRYKICCVENSNGELIHYSFIIPHCAKFSFMKKGDIQIGPCWTRPDHRGQGIYGTVLNYIAQKALESNPQANMYVLIREANIPSTKGIHKANYVPVGEVKKTKYLKLYKKAEWYDDHKQK